MPKPRTWKTAFKHFGTIIAHPQQYYRYKKYRDEFLAENHLPLHQTYHHERDNPGHPYPRASGPTVRESGVIYPGVDHAQTVVHGRLTDAQPHDHQRARGVAPVHLGESPGTLVVLRSEAPGNPPVLRAAVKRGVHGDGLFPNIGRTQHSTLSGGQSVASAALLDQGRIMMSSGHYRPDEAAAVKLAIHGKQTGTLLRRETDVVYPGVHHGDAPQDADLTMKRRMQVVSEWARTRWP